VTTVAKLIERLRAHPRPEDDVFITIHETLMLSDPTFEHEGVIIDLNE
jgi:hypothetical protein